MWSEDEYWSKGQLYIRRSQLAQSEEGLSAFWMALAMEFIARAALSKLGFTHNLEKV